MLKKIPMSAILLAGGKSSRMGTDKALLSFGEHTILETLFELLSSMFEQVLIVVNDKSKYIHLNIPENFFYEDVIKNQGPLGGLAAGFTHAQYASCFVTTCDMPLLNENFILSLANVWKGGMRDALCTENAVLPAQNYLAGEIQGRFRPANENFLEPFPGIYTRENRFIVRTLLDTGNFSMKHLLGVISVDRWILPGEFKEVMMNMNKPEDYEMVLDSLSFREKREISEISHPPGFEMTKNLIFKRDGAL